MDLCNTKDSKNVRLRSGLSGYPTHQTWWCLPAASQQLNCRANICDHLWCHTFNQKRNTQSFIGTRNMPFTERLENSGKATVTNSGVAQKMIHQQMSRKRKKVTKCIKPWHWISLSSRSARSLFGPLQILCHHTPSLNHHGRRWAWLAFLAEVLRCKNMLHKSMCSLGCRSWQLQVTVFKFYPSDPTYLIGGPCLSMTQQSC